MPLQTPSTTEADRPRRPTPNPAARAPRAFRLYRAEIWKLGLLLVRCAPPRILYGLGKTLAEFAWWLGPSRRRTVIENLLPIVRNDQSAARRSARRLYQNFARKIVDLWRYESGQDIHHLFGELAGAERLAAAMSSGRGVLLVTPHLGNWEFGAPLLARHGIQLLALSLAEPHAPLTELRKNARARHGIETLVIQQDPFAFLEVIRRLERGAVVALLIDRPAPPTAAPIAFGPRHLAASIAPAELARASGCTILPVHLCQNPEGTYDAAVLPAIPYDRASLRDPAARTRLAQETFLAFEPIIRQHPDQWYHFVPIWQNGDVHSTD